MKQSNGCKHLLVALKIFSNMRLYTSLTFILLLSCFSINAQVFPDLDKSPLDFAYYPDNFAHDRQPGDEAIIRVIYGRPQMRDREVFGAMVPYGEVWRTGANEATEIKIYKDITIGGKKLSAGTYSLFTIPNEKSWEIIFNEDLDYWGAYSYNKSKDVLRIKGQTSSLTKNVEAFTIHFEKTTENSGVMRFAWEKTLVEIPFTH